MKLLARMLSAWPLVSMVVPDRPKARPVASMVSAAATEILAGGVKPPLPIFNVTGLLATPVIATAGRVSAPPEERVAAMAPSPMVIVLASGTTRVSWLPVAFTRPEMIRLSVLVKDSTPPAVKGPKVPTTLAPISVASPTEEPVRVPAVMTPVPSLMAADAVRVSVLPVAFSAPPLRSMPAALMLRSLPEVLSVKAPVAKSAPVTMILVAPWVVMDWGRVNADPACNVTPLF